MSTLNTTDTDARDELRSTAREFFEKRSDENAVRAAMESDEGFDRRLWELMATELGLQALLVPERFGGAGFAFTDMQIVLDEMGRALVCAPFLSSAVMAVAAMLASGDDEACEDLLPGIADGSSIATLAVTDADGHWEPSNDEVQAQERGIGWVLRGRRTFVIAGQNADVILVPAQTSGGPSVFAVRAANAGLTAVGMETLDMTRTLADLEFDGVAGTLVGARGAAEQIVRPALAAGLAGLAAEQAGAARRAMELAVDYAKVREQFGRPIGSFQAIKHKCADMLVEVESSSSLAYAAGKAIDEGSEEAMMLASMAKAYCSEAFTHVAAENIQVHGGIGFTWEHPAHLYYRRAKSTELLLGSPAHHRERMLVELGL
jgi:alkylation response protein AidB-like acyl-CoA dehydrogenase